VVLESGLSLPGVALGTHLLLVRGGALGLGSALNWNSQVKSHTYSCIFDNPATALQIEVDTGDVHELTNKQLIEEMAIVYCTPPPVVHVVVIVLGP
jgi:hypothetical protein